MGRKRDVLPELLKLGSEHFAKGQFGDGALTEEKMIGFAGEGSFIHRLGPLYYWAYGHAHEKDAAVPLHPHRGFEIFTYLLSGALEHRDSLGNTVKLEAGDLQLMQTGSGLEHEELFVAVPASILQIWLDPNFRAEIEREPVFEKVVSTRFPLKTKSGRALVHSEVPRESYARCVLGLQSPVSLRTPHVEMQDVHLIAGDDWEGLVSPGEIWAGLVLKGQGTGEFGGQSLEFTSGEWLVFQPASGASWRVKALTELRIVWLSVPREPSYALFPKPRGAR